MKMAAAEAACETGSGFSVLAFGDLESADCGNVVTVIEIPGLLGFLANGDPNATVQGVADLIPRYEAEYGATLPEGDLYGERSGDPVNYVPLMWVTYWGFRLMIAFGAVAAFAAVVALWLTRKGTVPRSPWIMRLALLGILAPFAASAAGWIFTEMGRQPFVVAPNPNPSGIDGVFMFTAAAVSPGVTAGEMIFSVITLTAVYAVLLVVELVIMVRYVRGGVAAAMPELGEDDDTGSDDTDKRDVLAFAY
jgi:cytochrome d ubiquinol oxidase subunit I